MKKLFAAALLGVGLLVGVSGTVLTTNQTRTASNAQMATLVASSSTPEMKMSPPFVSSTSVSSMSMAHMTVSLTGATGNDFDRKFLSEMTAHHQGALSMAKLAATQAKHQEVKDLAKNILSSQTSQIARMRQWQKEWGYDH